MPRGSVIYLYCTDSKCALKRPVVQYCRTGPPLVISVMRVNLPYGLAPALSYERKVANEHKLSEQVHFLIYNWISKKSKNVSYLVFTAGKTVPICGIFWNLNRDTVSFKNSYVATQLYEYLKYTTYLFNTFFAFRHWMLSTHNGCKATWGDEKPLQLTE